MAYPYLFHETFSNGDAVSGTISSSHNQGRVMHFSRMAEQEPPLYPLAGDSAFGFVADLDAGDSAAASVAFTQAIAQGATRYLNISFMLSEDVEANHGDNVEIVVFTASSTTEASVVIQFSDEHGWLLIPIEGTSIPIGNGVRIDPGVPYNMDVKFMPHASDSLLEVYFAEERVGASLSGFASAAIDAISVGAPWVGTAFQNGKIVIGEVIFDDEQIFPADEDDKMDMAIRVDASRHLFVGAGTVVGVDLELGNVDNTAELFDTDRTELWRGKSRAGLNSEIKTLPTERDFMEGCYIKLSGTNPRAWVKFGEVENDTVEEVIEYGREVAATDPYTAN